MIADQSYGLVKNLRIDDRSTSELFLRAASHLGAGLIRVEPCGGGSINQGWKLGLSDGRDVFVKSRPDADPVEFEQEAAGLDWLAVADGLPVPEVLGVIESGDGPGLLLEWVEPCGPLDRRGEEAFGRGLATVHRSGADRFGQVPGSSGSTIRVGPIELNGGGPDGSPDFASLYASRIADLAGRAERRGALSAPAAGLIAQVCERMDELAGPPEPPARTHGDLWSGNLLVSAKGDPYLIDPAAHGAHRELDLAMLALFGAPSDRFLAAYREEFPLAPEFRDRIDLWQIQPLLLHAIFFGGGYGEAAARAARGYL